MKLVLYYFPYTYSLNSKELPRITNLNAGFNVESVEYRNTCFTVWDIAGQETYRPLWHHYYSNAQGLIFVVDSNDCDRISEAKTELYKMVMYISVDVTTV